MRALRTLGRWASDWRNGATLVVTIVVVLVGLVVNDAITGRREAFDALKQQTAAAVDSRQAATRRIDLLQARIDDLIGRGEANAVLLGELVAEVEALRAQVRGLGGVPIVAEPSARTSTTGTTTTTARPAAEPSPPAAPTTTAPSPTTTTTTPPAPSPEPGPAPRPATPIPFPCSTLFLPVLCTQGD